MNPQQAEELFSEVFEDDVSADVRKEFEALLDSDPNVRALSLIHI